MKHDDPPRSVLDEDEGDPRDDAPPRSALGKVKAGRTIMLFGLAAVAIAVTGVVGRSHDEERLARWTDKQAVPTVAVVAPARGSKTSELVLPGDVEAFYSAAIHGQTSGYVREWRKDIGAEARQGDVLAVIDTPELDQSIAVAESEVAKAKANLALAKVTAQRWDSLRASAAVSQQTADEKTADARARAAEVAAAQASLDRLKAQKTFANIVAPFDGVVTSRNVDVGSLVKGDSNDGAALFSVADIHRMRIYVRAPEAYAAALTSGMKATLQLPEYPDRVFEATVETTSRAIDRKSRSLLVELYADNEDGALTPGAFARVHFQIPPDPKALRLPANALLFRDNAIEVATLDPDNRVVLKTVRIARDLGSEVEIDGGLSAGDRVVANPPESLGDGEEVRVAGAGTGTPSSPAGQRGARRERPGDARQLAASERGRVE
ncbi:RND family efflux transporter MFP subunit [Roseiarcus fermentans]|uniref:RND family efflux transporter MFP subunit n=1 Tax=Roseiarcus fermentans TaxID=1473586 RepID=A0A366EP13_9HYPH|nr:efflux RND transporter periplasmic adaptor subunit [Roseiarcus fermentans]RBP04157.1 RND family efflux transporter MFP subunit [Roseiarcus fermentans]